MKSKILVIVTAVVFVAMGVFLITRPDNPGGSQAGSKLELDNQPVMGEEDAPVQVVEFGDYKCPACKSWSQTVFPKLQENYINSGDVSFTYVNTLFHGEKSRLAALASESVWDRSPEAFWSYHQTIFENHPGGQSQDEAWVTPDSLGDMAAQVDGAPAAEQVAEDVQQGTYEEQVSTDESLVDEYNIQFTPSILVNGTLIEDPMDWESVQAAVEEELNQES
ncbi:DsbA family protein [Salibacterium qingdaonense]|uniref:Protein-disulfide isomerase n=1 Tax=Salibacterium qingdaonense TaxID=266892 RepID=A0A1I4KIQ2_9BACI|nr:DsbA family protein [Salibacterium qingdaonense]SFL78648.1 Protein-disulfide isomerase [Salibacterium qingdaonense]